MPWQYYYLNIYRQPEATELDATDAVEDLALDDWFLKSCGISTRRREISW